MIYFTADPHFFHTAVIKYEKRPFETVEEMNEAIINNWNTDITSKDEVYILGDLSLGGKTVTTELIYKLKGRLYFINGNHDKLNLAQKARFEWVKDYYQLKIQGYTFILFHFPIFTWDKKHYGSIHLHGHTHTNSHSDWEHPNKINVGMDHWSFKPVSLDRIVSLIEKKSIK
jgi:calcineurin-like phosphoesterase family protein